MTLSIEKEPAQRRQRGSVALRWFQGNCITSIWCIWWTYEWKNPKEFARAVGRKIGGRPRAVHMIMKRVSFWYDNNSLRYSRRRVCSMSRVDIDFTIFCLSLSVVVKWKSDSIFHFTRVVMKSVIIRNGVANNHVEHSRQRLELLRIEIIWLFIELWHTARWQLNCQID